MRPPRATSPHQGRQIMRNQSLRQRRPDHKADEIIRFVRDLQFERQPTLLRLQKKAPLPGIGQTRCTKHSNIDAGFVDRGCESAESDDDCLLDNEMSRVDRSVNPRLDPFVRDMLTLQRGNTGVSNTDYLVLSRSLTNNNIEQSWHGGQSPTHKQNSFIRPFKNIKRSSKCHTGSVGCHGNAGAKQQLPPLGRDDIPDRPMAPSPCRTPPTSNFPNLIEEEPIDFLDLS